MPRTLFGSDLSILYNTVHEDDKDQMKQAFRAIQEERLNQNLEFRIVLHDNSEKWIKMKAYISAKGNYDIIIGIATDISAERTYSETLQKFNDKKNSVLQILAHDLLGPLGNIQMSTFLLQQDTRVSENGPVKELIEAINKNSKRSVTMIQDLINSEFLQTSEAAFVKKRVDIVDKITDIIEQYKQSPVLIQQRFNFQTSSKSLFINIDESKFLQAINNLLSNALNLLLIMVILRLALANPMIKISLLRYWIME